jgi:hypothetical protein
MWPHPLLIRESLLGSPQEHQRKKNRAISSNNKEQVITYTQLDQRFHLMGRLRPGPNRSLTNQCLCPTTLIVLTILSLKFTQALTQP